jgi:hypothetical protein
MARVRALRTDPWGDRPPSWSDHADALLQRAAVATGRWPDALAGIRILDEQAAAIVDAMSIDPVARILPDADDLVAEGRARLLRSLEVGGPFARIAGAAGLEPGGADVEVLALLGAVEVDPRRQRLVAFLQDDVQRTRPTVHLVGALLGEAGVAALARSRRLRRTALVAVDGDAAWSSRMATLDELVLWRLAGEAEPLDPALPADAAVVDAGASDGGPTVVLAPSVDATRRREAALAACTRPRALVCAAPTDVAGWDAVVRTATVGHLGVVIDVGDRLEAIGRRQVERADHLWWGLTSSMELAPDTVPTGATRELAPPVPLAEHDEVAAQVGDLPPGHRVTADQLHLLGLVAPFVEGGPAAAIRRLGAGPLERLARRVRPRRSRADIVLTPDQDAQLDELLLRYRLREVVHGEWHIPAIPSAGVVAMLSGPSGTGKTTAAEVVAAELGLDLYVVDISSVVDKYIGETEKNLERIFDAATAGNHVLLFDEADALFGTRTAVSDARDRYANVEVSYLLQRLETFDGMLLLTTNLVGNIDSAFMRRVHVAMHFPVPDEPERRRIWERWLGEGAPLGDIDLDLLTGLEVAGGVIRNACLHAAFLAAAGHGGGRITTGLLRQSMQRELVKLGRLVPPDAMGEPSG